jgi:hypothetical protein
VEAKADKRTGLMVSPRPMTESTSTTDAPARRKARARPPPVESKPIIAGRLWIPITMLVVLGLIANPNFNSWVTREFGPQLEARKGGAWVVGQDATLNVTLITADYVRLACGHDNKFDGSHCEFNAQGQPWPEQQGAPLDDNKASIIQPYRTSDDNRLVLLAGLWATPELALRLHREPPRGVPEKRLIRFDATCDVTFIGKMDELKLRWDASAPWQTEKNAFIARPKSCEIHVE